MNDRPVVVDTDAAQWEPTEIEGLVKKGLWEGESGASIALLRFAKGSGIAHAHRHPSNQFWFCLSGEYEDLGTGVVSRPGTFYWNPKDMTHGPTMAREECVLIEVYDGPHYYPEDSA